MSPDVKRRPGAPRRSAFSSLSSIKRDPSVSYEAVARQLGLSQEAARKAVSRLRERYRDAVRSEIAGTLRNPSEKDIDTEMRSLLGALG